MEIVDQALRATVSHFLQKKSELSGCEDELPVVLHERNVAV
jgi:hypothetical protein